MFHSQTYFSCPLVHLHLTSCFKKVSPRDFVVHFIPHHTFRQLSGCFAHFILHHTFRQFLASCYVFHFTSYSCGPWVSVMCFGSPHFLILTWSYDVHFYFLFCFPSSDPVPWTLMSDLLVVSCVVKIDALFVVNDFLSLFLCIILCNHRLLICNFLLLVLTGSEAFGRLPRFQYLWV